MNTEKRIEVERKIVAFLYNAMAAAGWQVDYIFDGQDNVRYAEWTEAKVLYVGDDTDAHTQSYANTRAMQLAPEMAQALRLIHEVLTDHPEASTGNSKVHYALMAAYAMLSKMQKKR